MSARLFYIKLELKRAFRRLPQMAAGAVTLLILMGAAALLAGRLLYGDQASGRIPVGVILPEDDLVAKQAVSMLSSLESVESMCDFSYMDQEEALKGLVRGELYAVLEVPQGFVQDIISGENTPITVILPERAGTESRIFKELTDAGAKTLGASQAGIYAGDELLTRYDIAVSIPRLEEDLNRLYMGYSLPRMDYFRSMEISATGDVSTAEFYGISAFVMALLLCAIPVSGYLAPMGKTMRRKLDVAGVGSGTRAWARILGLAVLMLFVSLPLAAVAGAFHWLSFTPGTVAVLALVCLAAAAFCVCLFLLAGGLLAGVMLLFLAVSVTHFVAGGFLPLVFLPLVFRSAAAFMPSAILMDGMKMIVAGVWSGGCILRLAALAAVSFLVCVLAEVRRR